MRMAASHCPASCVCRRCTANARPHGSYWRSDMGDRWNNGGPGSVGNASYVWLPFVKDESSSVGWKMPALNGGGNGQWQIKDY